jgi:Flp pilus assembly protein TadD
MRSYIRFLVVLAAIPFSFVQGSAQSGEICGESGGTVWLNSKAVYGRVVLKGVEAGAKWPKVTVSLMDGGRVMDSATVGRSGNYCFREVDGRGASLVVEVEGREAVRQVLASSGPAQFQQDFEILVTGQSRTAKPGVVSAKYQYSRNEKNAALFEEANAAASGKDQKRAIRLLNELVAIDPADFIAWMKLGELYFDESEFARAETAYRKALAAKPDLSPAMMNIGRIYLIQKRFDDGIELLKKAALADRTSARTFQLLGEAYILNRQGEAGVVALNEAIRLEPIAMAESHLLLARLYDVAGAKYLASREYRLFLEKVPKHPDRKKFEKYIRENPETGG